MESCAFDKLFAKSVPHILEKIFFSLDYASYKNCLEVNGAWNELLTTKQYRMKVKLVFQEGLKKDEAKLWYASKDRSGEVRKLLSSGMLDVDCEFGCNSDKPLHEASRNGHLLLNKGADPNKKNRDGSTPLQKASLNGHAEVVQLLLKSRANPNEADYYGYTPLHEASLKGHQVVVQILLEGGAEPHVANKYGQTPPDCASRVGHKDVEKVLMEWRGSF